MGADIDLLETETRGGWLFRGRITAGGVDRDIEMALSWADYEYWSRGLARPVDVAKALLRVAATETDGALPPVRFDAARFRRTIDGFDEKLRDQLGVEGSARDPDRGDD